MICIIHFSNIKKLDYDKKELQELQSDIQTKNKLETKLEEKFNGLMKQVAD